MGGHNEPETENATAADQQSGGNSSPFATQPSGHAIDCGITVGKRTAAVDGKQVEIFTMTLGGETIELLPHRNWAQLDHYKWSVRGKLPGTPAGLETAVDHVKLAGETVSPGQPDACARLERLFAEWVALEREGMELARRKAQAPKPAAIAATPATPVDSHHRFEVEVDKEDQVHIHCVQGRERLATIGLNPAGFQSLISQGLLRKPRTLKTGALHNWVELDGTLYSFEKGHNDSARLTCALNETYRPASSLGHGKDVVVFANAASSTGFDIQFPAKVGGVPDHRRRPLDETALDLLQDPERCGLLQPGLVIKLTRPTLIFKRKTPDGGERYLEPGAETLVTVNGEDGEVKTIELSHPVNYLHLSSVELTAIFNHPSINRHAQALGTTHTPAAAASPLPPRTSSPASGAPPAASLPQIAQRPAGVLPAVPESRHSTLSRSTLDAPRPHTPPRPNLWLKSILARQSIRFDWFTCLVYGKVAARIGNSREVQLPDGHGWLIALGDSTNPAEPGCKGIFLTDKGAFGFLSAPDLIRFENGKLQIGSAAKMAEARLLAVGLDRTGRFFFILNDEWQSKFPSLPTDLSAELSRLGKAGALLMTVSETLDSATPLETVWTVPVEQANPSDPQALEHHPPA